MKIGFRYWDLSGGLHLGLLGYTRELQEYAKALEEEVLKLRDDLSRSGCSSYRKDAEKWHASWIDLNIEMGKQQRDKIEMEARKDTEIRRLQNENAYLQDLVEKQRQQLQAYETSGPRTQKTRDSSGRFCSNISKDEKKKIVYDMKNRGCTWVQIGDRLLISVDTAKQYYADYSRWLKRYREVTVQEGQKENAY